MNELKKIHKKLIKDAIRITKKMMKISKSVNGKDLPNSPISIHKLIK